MILDLRTADLNRSCAALKDARAEAIAKAFGLDAAAAWIAVRLEEQPKGLSRYDIRCRLPRAQPVLMRSRGAIAPLIEQLRDRLGAEALLTDQDGYRLTAFGRVRIRIGLKEPVI